MTPLRIRQAIPADVARLVEMNIAAYPELVADGIVFDASQIAAHLAVFPEGQLVAVSGDRIVGAIATLIVSSARADAAHTWVEITSHGTFAGHDPAGDILYLADVYADPSVRSQGVGAALYEALFALCRRKHLARVVAGGRLWGYHDVAGEMTPEEYVDRVTRGERKDRVLTSQLRAGFAIHGVLADYLDDWRSGGFATHLVWENPDLADASPHAPSPVAPAQPRGTVSG